MVDVEYGCNVQNKFEGCTEASDPFELLSSTKGGKGPGLKVKKDKLASKEKISPAKPPVVKSQESRAGKSAEKFKASSVVEQRPSAAGAKPLVDQQERDQRNDQQRGGVGSRGGRDGGREVGGRGGRYPRGGRGGSYNEGDRGQRDNQGEQSGRGGNRGRPYGTVTFHRGGRGGKYEGGEERRQPDDQPRNNGQGGFSGEPGPEERAEQDDRPDMRPFYRRSGRGGFGGGVGGGGGRQFDRHSGSSRSGIRPEEKRHGGGSFNWGRDTEVRKDMPEKAETDDVEVEGIMKEGQEQVEVEVDMKPPRTPSPVLMTLEEYRRQQQQKQKAAAARKPFRQAGEGEDPKQWATPVITYQKKPTEKSKYFVAEQRDMSEEEEDEESEDEMTKINQSVTSSIFVSRPPPTYGGRRGTYHQRGEAAGSEYSGRPYINRQHPADRQQFEYRRSARGGRGGSVEGRQEERPANLPPDPSEFPELC